MQIHASNWQDLYLNLDFKSEVYNNLWKGNAFEKPILSTSLNC